MISRYFLLLCLLFPGALVALPVGAPLAFDDPEQAQQYQQLLRELRCTVCQNQSLVDSDAQLAADLRRQVYERTTAGEGREEIIDFMVRRYGEFVLYRPPLRSDTWLLWFAPFVLLGSGLLLWWWILRSKRAVSEQEYDIRED